MQLLKSSFIFCLIAVSIAFSTVPPAHNKAIPEYLRGSIKRIQQDYHQGYWAERFHRKLQERTLGLMKQSAAQETVNVPIIFGRYSDVSTKITTAKFQELLFDGPNPTGTMTQYYLENSYNQLLMTGKCLGWYSAPRTFEYYVHDGHTGLTYGGPDFTIDVLILADDSVDFSQFVKYVQNDTAHVPQVGVVHTGGDAAAGADNIWSHRWNIRWRLNQRKVDLNETILNPARVTGTGQYVTNDTYHGLPVVFDGDYAIQPELEGNSNTGNNPKPIGVFTHEFGHIFGLPDLYDTDNTSQGLGGWCLMASGSYGGDQSHEEVPAHMSAWCKERLGWVIPSVVTTYVPNQKFRHVEMFPEIMKINVRGTPGGEYFLIENRQQTGFDKYLTNSGLLIFHVDPAKTNNRDENHYMVDLQQADGLRSLNLSGNRGDAGDPFPGSTNNRNFDGVSVPNSNDYANLASYVGIRNISNPGLDMFADLDIGTRSYIVIRKPSFVEANTGNGNGRIDPGETGSMKLNLENIYPVKATNAEVRVLVKEPDVTVDSTAVIYSINGLQKVDSLFSIVITANAQAVPRIIPVTVEVKTTEAVFKKSFEMMFGYPGTVIVDLDSVGSIEDVGGLYRKLLEKNGKHFEIVSSKEKTLSELNLASRAKVIIVSGRKKSDIITDSLAQLLLAYQSAGGKLFISGQNILEDMKMRNSSYRTELLHATWTKNVVFGKNLIGIASDVLGAAIPKLILSNGESMPNQSSPDEFNLDGTDAHAMFRWNTTSGTNYGGLWWEHPTNGSKLVFFSFGLEGANDSAVGITYKSTVMETVLNWFDGITATPEVGSTVPLTMALFDNYPNPFNPTTTITYALSSDRDVSLVVFDILGRAVETLVNEKQAAGSHTVSFDASALSSGIYFYTLRSGNFHQTKKMMVLK